MTSFPALPASVSAISIPVGEDVELHVLRAGSGTPLLLIPGWSFSAEVFVHQLTELADDYDVIAIDPRGHGKSSKPLTGNSYPQRGRDLAALIDAIGLDQFVLAGWSFGTLDALSYLQQFGHDRVSKLILIDEPPRVPFDPADSTQWGEAALSHDGLPSYLTFLSTAREDFLAFIATDALGLEADAATTHPDAIKLVADGAQTPEHIAIITGAEGLASDYSATAIEYDASGKPLLFFANESWADDARAWVSANLPHAEFATIPVHAGFLTDPDAFNTRVREFVG